MPRPRANAADRGYDHKHRKLKDTYRATIARGDGYCTEPICLFTSRWIPPQDEWDLAHNRTSGGYRGPAHSKCNRAEGATYGNKLRGKRRHILAAQPATWNSRIW